MADNGATRREFVAQTAALAAASGIGVRALAAENNVLRVGLVGAGGRGGGAAIDALMADPQTKLTAIGDLWPEPIAARLAGYANNKDIAARIDVPEERRFTGFDAYRQVIDACDVVLLATPPAFRPVHLAYAVERGKHIFCEKPVATDPAGVRQCLAAGAAAKAKGLSLVSGLCWRYHPTIVAAMRQVLDGLIGEVVAVETDYCSGGVWDPKVTRGQCGSDMEYQLRNWYYYLWISGDHIVEQAVHSIDKGSWALGDRPPERCRAVGGRQVRTGEQYGNIWDHFSIIWEYAGGARSYHQCRHWRNTPGENSDTIIGTKGILYIKWDKPQIVDHDGREIWKYEGPGGNMYREEHVALFRAIRRNEPLDNTAYMCQSTLLGIMGRQAAYTGQHITWEQIQNSQQDLVPAKLDWGPAPEVKLPTPGATRFI